MFSAIKIQTVSREKLLFKYNLKTRREKKHEF